MKKIIIFTVLWIQILLLSACNQNNQEIKVIATSIPHAEILEQAKPLLKEQGYTLKIIVTSDYYFPNPSVALEDADANFFQHIPFLNRYNQEQPNKSLEVAIGVHIEPIGLYANSIKALNDIPNQATVLISNSKADHGRALNLLQDAGLITLKSGIDITSNQFEISEAILSNPKNLIIRTDVSPDFLVAAYQNKEADLYIINSNYALEGKLNPLTDTIFIESTIDNPYVNVLVTRSELLTSPKIKALIDVLQSEAIKSFIVNKYGGAVLPV